MDSADFAHEREELLRAAAIQCLVKPGKEPSAWSCDDCLQKIPDARRQAAPGCTRCVECQTVHESRRHP